MRNAFDGILEKYGEETEISVGDTAYQTKTFIQPVINRSSGGEKLLTPIGEVNTAHYYWFAPENIVLDMEKSITVSAGGITYDLVRAEKFRVSGRASHWEGILKVRDA